MIDILIPTYNRAEFLKKNIFDLCDKIRKANLQHNFRIHVSDNCSTDNTATVLTEIENQVNIDFFRYRQDVNIGLEPNVLFLLGKATADYVMYLGDDDFLPNGYLEFASEKTKIEGAYCVIPGFSALHPGNIIFPARNAGFQLRKYSPGFSTVCKLSNFGHQLSGLVTRRGGLIESYMEHQELRNIYPFIFFVTYCMLRGDTYYAPKYQVLVSQGNSKNWSYDDSGLLIDIFRNYKIAFPKQPFKEVWASLQFAIAQSWRLRVGPNPLNAVKAFAHLILSKEVNPLIKLLLIAIYPYCYIKKSLLFFKKRIYTGSAS